MAEPESTRSVAEMSAGIDVAGEREVMDVGDVVKVSVAPAATNSPAIGASELVTTRNEPPIAWPPVPSYSKAPMSRGPIAGQTKAAVDVDLRVAQEVGRDRRRFPRVVDCRRNRGQLEVGVDVEVRRTIRAGPGVDREDEGRVADEVPLVAAAAAAVVPSKAGLKPLPRSLVALD